MLHSVDILLTILHLVIVGFNLFGWIPKATRKANFISLLVTAASWFILGIWFGIGYCPVTDWQWEVKARLGQDKLPASFIKYYADKITGHDFSPFVINTITAVSFLLAIIASVYVNFLQKPKPVTR
jgi:hypothetical protein